MGKRGRNISHVCCQDRNWVRAPTKSGNIFWNPIVINLIQSSEGKISETNEPGLKRVYEETRTCLKDSSRSRIYC